MKLMKLFYKNVVDKYEKEWLKRPMESQYIEVDACNRTLELSESIGTVHLVG